MQPDPHDDGSYLAQSAGLQQRRMRRLYTFTTPLLIRAQVRAAGTHSPLQPAEDLSVRWAEGTSEDGDGDDAQSAQLFLVLDVLGLAQGACYPETVVGIWVRESCIASAQVQTPLRLRPGAPRSILDLQQRGSHA